MDFNSILNVVKEYVPVPVIVAVVVVIMLVNVSIMIASLIEDAIEEKKGKQIKIFDHKKIWLSLFLYLLHLHWQVILPGVSVFIMGLLFWELVHLCMKLS